MWTGLCLNQGVSMDNAPVFVKVDECKAISDITRFINEKLERAKLLLAEIEELKRNEENVLADWKIVLSDVEVRLDEIKKSAPEAEL